MKRFDRVCMTKEAIEHGLKGPRTGVFIGETATLGRWVILRDGRTTTERYAEKFWVVDLSVRA